MVFVSIGIGQYWYWVVFVLIGIRIGIGIGLSTSIVICICIGIRARIPLMPLSSQDHSAIENTYKNLCFSSSVFVHHLRQNFSRERKP